MNGYGNGLFGPNDALSRAMLAQIIYNRATRPAVTGSTPFPDVAAGTWYTDAVTWAAAKGIVLGCGNGSFGPMDAITREQLALMLYRHAGGEKVQSELSLFADADQISPWATEAMAWAVANDIVEGKGNGLLDPQGQATRAEAATMLMRYFEQRT